MEYTVRKDSAGLLQNEGFAAAPSLVRKNTVVVSSYLAAYLGRPRIVGDRLSVYNLILRPIHVQQGVKLGEAGGFGGQVFLMGKGLIHRSLGLLKLPAGVGQVILRILQAGGQAFEGVVQALDVTVEVSP